MPDDHPGSRLRLTTGPPDQFIFKPVCFIYINWYVAHLLIGIDIDRRGFKHTFTFSAEDDALLFGRWPIRTHTKGSCNFSGGGVIFGLDTLCVCVLASILEGRSGARRIADGERLSRPT